MTSAPFLENPSWSSSSHVFLSHAQYSVGLFYDSEPFCIGTVILSYFILTAASCLVGKPKPRISASVIHGGKAFGKSEIKIKQILVHPGFNSSRTFNDLAILILDERFEAPGHKETNSLLNSSEGTTETPIELSVVPQNTSDSFLTSPHHANYSILSCVGDEKTAQSVRAVVAKSKCVESPLQLNQDELCLTSRNFENTTQQSSVKCSLPLGGSGLLCTYPKKSNVYLCGVLHFTSNNVSDFRVYTSISQHSQWIHQVTNRTQVKTKEAADEEVLRNWDNDDYSDLASSVSHVLLRQPIAPDSYGPQIAGSNEVVHPGEFPFQLSIQKQENDRWAHICGAAILDAKTVLTAAHCFDPKDSATYKVVAGKNLLNPADTKHEQHLSLRKTIIHPDYIPAQGKQFGVKTGNDIAVVHLETPILFNRFAKPAWISPFPISDMIGKDLTISGWGQTPEAFASSNKLLKANLTVMAIETCPPDVFSLKGFICALNPKQRICKGDSGGPLVLLNQTMGSLRGHLVVGIASLGKNVCQNDGTRGGFTDANYFSEWIEANRAEPSCPGPEPQFRCTSGQCIHKSYRWDKEADCDDASDEIGSPNLPQEIIHMQTKQTPVSTSSCGGFIKVLGDYELVYKVPPEILGRTTVCVWVLAAEKGKFDSIEILDNEMAQFDGSTSRLTCFFNFTTNGASTFKVNTKHDIGAPFLALYFRTTSAAPNSGFHLKLREVQVQGNTTGGEAVKYINLTADPTALTPPHFDYEYTNNERTFIIVKPKEAGSRLKLFLHFVYTETNYDWFQILRENAGEPTHLLFQNESDWLVKTYETLPDDPFIIYFHSDDSNSGGGFLFSYEEKIKKIYTPTTRTCGGLIPFVGEDDLVYKVPTNRLGKNSVCVWVVASELGGLIEAEVVENPLAQFDPSSGGLTIIQNFTVTDSHHRKLTAFNKNVAIGFPFFVLHFRTNSSAPNAGFHLRFREPEVKNNTITWPVKYIERKAVSSPVEFQYPAPPLTEYAPNERTFIVVKPGVPGTRLRLNLKSLNTEDYYDWLEILTVRAIPKTDIRVTGKNSWNSKIFEAEEDEPFIIYFHSDQSNNSTGFKFVYEWIKQVPSGNLEVPHSV